jgi:hypothetical protein
MVAGKKLAERVGCAATAVPHSSRAAISEAALEDTGIKAILNLTDFWRG